MAVQLYGRYGLRKESDALSLVRLYFVVCAVVKVMEERDVLYLPALCAVAQELKADSILAGFHDKHYPTSVQHQSTSPKPS